MMDSERGAQLEVLLRHEFAFVLIGGAAIRSYGRMHDTLDVDVVPDVEQDTGCLALRREP
jgi:hypothetical protein